MCAGAECLASEDKSVKHTEATRAQYSEGLWLDTETMVGNRDRREESLALGGTMLGFPQLDLKSCTSNECTTAYYFFLWCFT